MAALVDTSVLVYRYDPRFSKKQSIATRLLRDGIASDSIRVAHQSIMEFVSAVTRARRGSALLDSPTAFREAEEMLRQFTVLYPTEEIVRTALRGAAAYQLAWFDAHLWAYAECNGLGTLYSEDFQHDRMYGTVRVVNPFVKA